MSQAAEIRGIRSVRICPLRTGTIVLLFVTVIRGQVDSRSSRCTVTIQKSKSVITLSLKTSRVASVLQLDEFADLAVEFSAPGSLFRASWISFCSQAPRCAPSPLSAHRLDFRALPKLSILSCKVYLPRAWLLRELNARLISCGIGSARLFGTV